ncbi:hypothetical protein H5J25_14860 [Sphingomonas aliaeris]|uniref:Uncharacterized protein n=1 Tax=Sphingomonas aliaeris TaxID=2759526 RepID=A0A974S3M4_9SPHN|nr:hypothetical protein [Sphingomonas aliaeris]QQV76692.1 hypothetical protein H5J25_14860 [Sphingomonas aliaeris]
MFRVPRPALPLLSGLIAAAFPLTAFGQVVQTDPATSLAPPPLAATPFASAPLDDSTLGAAAGREDTQQAATATQVAGVSQNSVGDNVRTGDASISDNAFQNLSGLSILNVNTGNNVAINAAMNVNIAIQPIP